MSSNPYTDLARNALAHYLETGQPPAKSPSPLPDSFQIKRGTFVSIKKGNELRGCIGTLTPCHKNIWQEIVHNAIKAGSADPRFPSVSHTELPHLNFSVDILSPLEKVDDVSQLDCKRYGLVLKCGQRQGVLLPNLDGVPSVDEQIKICLSKGKIDKDENYTMYRFEVERQK
jgi:AmmeMemoRadiSam system protein A